MLLLVAGFVAGLIAFAPLEVALRASGAERNGLGWSSVDGTVMHGTVQGLTVGAAAYGDAELKLDAGALLLGNLKYRFEWNGKAGRGTGDVSVGFGQTLVLKDFEIDLDLLQLEQAARWIQQSGGRVQIRGEVIQFRGGNCVEARGTAQSDVLDRNREILGAGWSEMRGDLRCENGELVVPLESKTEAGADFAARLIAMPGSPGRFEARVSGLIPAHLGFALPIAGFQPEGRDFVYRFSNERSVLP